MLIYHLTPLTLQMQFPDKSIIMEITSDDKELIQKLKKKERFNWLYYILSQKNRVSFINDISMKIFVYMFRKNIL